MRRSQPERDAIEVQATAQIRVREATMNYLVANGMKQDLAYWISTGAVEAERFVHIMEEVFNHLDDLLEEVDKLERKPAKDASPPVVKVGGTDV